MKFPPKIKLNLRQRQSLAGYLFTMPFILGFIMFFLRPLFQSILFSFSELRVAREGWTLNYVGFENYNYALMIHETYPRDLIATITRLGGNVFFIILFSFFAAIILNEKFKGRAVVRLIFFLPVILGAGIILRLEQNDFIMQSLAFGADIFADGEAEGGYLAGEGLRNLLLQLRMPEVFLLFIMEAVDRIPEIINSSGIQILIFLAGLQSIPPSIYEAAEVEGSTRWESFWMITLPMMSPLILTNIVYTVIDFFTAVENPMIELIRGTAFGGAGYGRGIAMAWLYFLVVSIILMLIIWIVSRRVYYVE